MTRISLAMHKMLKRVGFVFLLLGGVLLADAQPPDTLWTRVFGFQTEDESLYDVCSRWGGGVVLAGEGRIDSTWELEKGYLIALNEQGMVEWSRSYSPYGMENIVRVIQTSDGGYLTAGLANVTGFKVIKVDYEGNVQWQHQSAFGATSATTVSALEAPDSTYVVAHSIGVDSLPNIVATFFTHDGDTVMVRRYGGISIDRTASLQATDSGYVILGSMDRYDDGIGLHQNAFALFIDSNGETQVLRWSESPNRDWAMSGVRDIFGRFLVAGFSHVDGNNVSHAFCTRFGANETPDWTTRFFEYTSGPSDILALQDDRSILSGSSGGVPYLFALDDEGSLVWSATYPLRDPMVVRASCIDFNENVYVAGTEIVDGSDRNVAVIRYESLMGSSSAESRPSIFYVSQNYPNPFNGSTQIALSVSIPGFFRYSVHDNLGRLVISKAIGHLGIGLHVIPLQLENSCSGIYYSTVTGTGQSETRRMTLIK